jgi:hypothetical protein
MYILHIWRRPEAAHIVVCSWYENHATPNPSIALANFSLIAILIPLSVAMPN